ncbi:MAG: AraC family transcriptional regulator, partial [bacterium]|nr:AraC family transcriptional regulator [bacterium]
MCMLTLDQVLDGLTVEVTPFALCEARGDGLLDLGARDSATLHYVLSGSG